MVGQKVTFLVFESSLLLLYFQFLFTAVSSSLNDIIFVCRWKQFMFLYKKKL